MAIAATMTNHTPHMLRYSLTSDGANAVNVDAAQLLADTVPGPLRAVLTQAVANQAAARALAFNRNDIQIEMTPRVATALWWIDANVNAGLLRLTLTCAAADALGTPLEITYRHTTPL